MTKDIDPLVEKVARALCIEDGEDNPDRVLKLDGYPVAWTYYVDESRAAIEAVLAWYSKTENINEDMIREVIINRGVSAHQVVAAAMAAELKRRQE